MRLTLAFVFAVSLAGCIGSYTPAEPASSSADMARGSSSGSGGGTGAGTGAGTGGNGASSGGAADMSQLQSSTDMARAAGGDMSGGGGDMAGLKAFGAACTADAQCASNVCFIGGMQSFCSYRCTQATAATDCPVPPTTGVCNNQGYCK